MPHGNMHEDTWQLKVKCQGMAMHEKWLEWRVGISDTWHGNTRCQVNWIRNSPPRQNQFGGNEKKRKKRKKEGRKEKEEELPVFSGSRTVRGSVVKK